MSQEPVAPIDVILYCEYCLNPITFLHKQSQEIFTREYLFVEHLYLCLPCAAIAGYVVSNRFLNKDKTITLSKT